jgi:hypothetical protein
MNAARNPSATETLKAQQEEAKEEYQALRQVVGWVPAKISAHEISLKFPNVVDVSLFLDDARGVRAVKVVPSVAPNMASFVNAFFGEPYLASLFVGSGDKALAKVTSLATFFAPSSHLPIFPSSPLPLFSSSPLPLPSSPFPFSPLPLAFIFQTSVLIFTRD